MARKRTRLLTAKIDTHTTYSVALLFRHRSRPDLPPVLASITLPVSGDNPLEKDEILARAEKVARADYWDVNVLRGTEQDFILCDSSISYCVTSYSR